MKNDGEQEAFEQLQGRYRKLVEERITAEANLRHAEQQLDELKNQARERYGTDDLEALKIKLEEMTTENTRLLDEYTSHLDDVEHKLQEVEAQYGQAESD